MTPRSLRVLRTMTLALTLAAAGPVLAAPRYTITELPASQPGAASAGLRLNRDGTVLGRDGDRTVLFKSGGVVDLTPLAGPGGSVGAINDAGHLAGARVNGSGETRVFLNTPGGTTNFGSLGDPGETATDLNNNDVIAGTLTLRSGARRAAYWNAGGIYDLGVLPDDLSSEAVGINDAGQIAGNSGIHGFIWKAGSGMTDIGALGGPGAATVVQGINNAGWLAGFSELTPHGRVSGFVYDGLVMKPIGDIGQLFPSLNSFARAINAGGAVVGESQRDDGIFSAFVYREGATFELQSLIDPVLGWDLRTARDINDRGQITGFGFVNGRQSAYLLTPIETSGAVPEPGVWALMILGFGAAGASLRRRRLAA
ncbi:MAG: PEP-CTERM sorting domain-containing protein [Phenylobacterium sp.]|uniref:PEPxxWA-CTERM sorting domain-containing protein n=1 Tax=Phenylobacterium sp. TaxID=1871053 RepID=UPI001205D625|nr:PEPxxWA-CTERM sorting domain-containing protein [Phenylobacterium sp.]TAL30238.1 MAG: PEP-CTERM sorting domain-containing protein [Phenylobacterium sp.]